jgi:hypothetical protein
MTKGDDFSQRLLIRGAPTPIHFLVDSLRNCPIWTQGGEFEELKELSSEAHTLSLLSGYWWSVLEITIKVRPGLIRRLRDLQWQRMEQSKRQEAVHIQLRCSLLSHSYNSVPYKCIPSNGFEFPVSLC